MSTVPEPPEARDPAAKKRLDSWKEIAAFFGRNERTVRRWEQTEGLPVHRHQHEKRGTVYAYTTELDAWLSGRGSALEKQASPPAGRKDRRFVWGVGLLGVLAMAGMVAWWYGWRGTWRAGGRTAHGPVQVRPLTSYPGSEKYPSFSPDGNQVAFSWDGEQQDNVDIYVKTMGAEALRRLTRNPEEELSSAWSPDGRWIAFLRILAEGMAAVVVIPAAGGEERKLAEVRNPPKLAVFGSHIAWSPNGEWLVAPDKDSPGEPYGLVRISLANGEKRRLTSPRVQQGDVAAAVSPDGHTVAIVRRTAFASTELYFMPISGTGAPEGPERQITSLGRLTTSPVWWNGGRELLFLSGDYYSEIGVWRITGSGSGPPEPVASLGDYDALLAVSRQGRLTFTREVEDSNIWRIRAGAPERIEPMPDKTPLVPSTRLEFNGQYSPDGKRISFESNRSGNVGIWLCQRDGSNAVLVTPPDGPRAWASRWSPDSRRLVFVSGGLHIINASGGASRQLTDGRQLNGAAPSWSWDGQWIYFQSNRSGRAQIWKMSANGGEPVQITQGGGLMALESMDGRYLYYTKGQALGSASLWRIPRPGGEEVQVLDGLAGWSSFDVAADGIYFIRVTGGAGNRSATYGSVAFKAGSIEFLHFESGRIEKIAAIERPVGVGLSVLSGGRGRFSEILYTQIDHQGSDLMLVEKIR